MNDDPCDDWPVVELRGELYVVQNWGDRMFVVFNRVSDSLQAWGDALREYSFINVRSSDMFELSMPVARELPKTELDNKRASGYRQFEYGGKRWKGRR